MISITEFENLKQDKVDGIREAMERYEWEIEVLQRKLAEMDNYLCHWETLTYKEHIFIESED